VQAVKASKEVRILAVLLGSIGSMAWITFVMAVSKGFAEVQAPWGWFFLVVLAGIFFLIPFLLVHGTAWVIRRFRQDT
jgi:predicted histidine transporter YuiF (NhaC family)